MWLLRMRASLFANLAMAACLLCICTEIVQIMAVAPGNVSNECDSGTACYVPHALLDWYESKDIPGQVSQNCVFRILANPQRCVSSQSSTVDVWQAAAVPDAATWSRCQHCLWDVALGRMQVWEMGEPQTAGDTSTAEVAERACASKRAPVGTIDLSASNWGEFFYAARNDRYQADLLAAPPCIALDAAGAGQESAGVAYVDRPVFILPLLTLHVGHVMVDLLEQVYQTMLASYGRVRKDALLLLDVANAAEQAVLPIKLYQLFAGAADTYGALLSVLSDLPVLPVSVLASGPDGLHTAKVVFSDVHLGLNGAAGHFSTGYLSHSMPPEELRDLPADEVESARLRALQRDLRATQHLPLKPPPEPRGVRLALVVERAVTKPADAGTDTDTAAFRGYISSKQSRNIVNVAEVLTAVLDELCPDGARREPPPRGRGQEQPNPLIGSVWRCTNPQHLWEVQVVVLEGMLHSAQRELFAKTDLLIAAAGTALHNSLFMQKPAAVLPIMQPGWCDWAWMYARQAHLLGLYTRSFCATTAADGSSGGIPGRSLHQWSRRFWQQGPRASKDCNFVVDIHKFRNVLHLLVGELDAQNSPTPDDSEGGMPEEDVGNLPGVPDVTTHTLAEVYVTSVEAQKKTDSGGRVTWHLSIRGELALPSDGSAQDSPLARMPHLSVCLQLPQGRSPTACAPLEDMNYYSELRVQVSHPAQELMLWLQATSTGGRLVGSECVVAIDARLPACGLLPPLLHLRKEDAIVALWVTQEAGNWSAKVKRGLHVHATHHIVATSGLALQRQMPAMCAAHDIPSPVCAEVASGVTSHIHQLLLATHLQVPKVQLLPSPRHPFVFLHVEKTAGTTLRELIVRAAGSRQLRSFVPCHGNPGSYVHCTVQSPTDVLRYRNGSNTLLRGVSVLAGHFSWGAWLLLPDWALARVGAPTPVPVTEKATAPPGDTPHAASEVADVPACLVMGRHPVERAISYYYQRCYGTPACPGYRKALNTLTADALGHIIRTHRHMLLDPLDPEAVVVLDEGMSDAACAALAGDRRTAGLRVGLRRGSFPAPAALNASSRARALHNAQQCVAGLQEEWGSTVRHILHFFPWLDTETEATSGAEGGGSSASDTATKWQTAPRRMSLFDGQETRLTLRHELRSVIESANSCDLELYAQMQASFRKQQQVLDAMHLYI